MDSSSPDVARLWAHRAAVAEHAVLARHVRRLLALPGTALGVVSWPAAPRHRIFLQWHLWWQAHLLDCAVDAWVRSPDPQREGTVLAIARSIRFRNSGRYTNSYYDDMAWTGLALQRAAAVGVDRHRIAPLVTALLDARAVPSGAIPWRRGDDFVNAPANGPAALLLCRSGFPVAARQIADWVETSLRIPGSDLIADGFHPGEDPQPVFYSYNQGAVLGAEVELARRGGDRSRAHRLVTGVAAELTSGGVLLGHGGGNGGLFTGILARYLALVHTDLPGERPADLAARSTAAELVLQAADSAWQHAIPGPHGPVFGADWTVPARLPGRGRIGRSSGAARVDSSVQPERDLSVQLSGWMLIEAAALVTRQRAPRSG